MTTQTVKPSLFNPLSLLLAAAAALLVAFTLTGAPLPFITTPRAAFFALFAVGFLMCSAKIARVAVHLGWVHPITLAGMLVGVLILAMVALVAFNVNLPLLNGERTAFTLLAGLIGFKFLLGLLALAWRG